MINTVKSSDNVQHILDRYVQTAFITIELISFHELFFFIITLRILSFKTKNFVNIKAIKRSI